MAIERTADDIARTHHELETIARSNHARDLETSTLNGMVVIERRPGHVYMRIPADLQKPITGGCSCSFCRQHPDRTPMWDTLAVTTRAPKDGDHDHAWTIHMPEQARRF